jgi:hypothetical protein
MGAWDHTIFGNDDACDWGSDLCSHEDLSFVEETLDKVLDVGAEYLEAPEACAGLAAAETVARLQGHFGVRSAYTAPVDDWVSSNPLCVPTLLAQKARAALDRILTRPSELLELWEETDSFQMWSDAVAEVRGRIDV